MNNNTRRYNSLINNNNNQLLEVNLERGLNYQEEVPLFNYFPREQQVEQWVRQILRKLRRIPLIILIPLSCVIFWLLRRNTAQEPVRFETRETFTTCPSPSGTENENPQTNCFV